MNLDFKKIGIVVGIIAALLVLIFVVLAFRGKGTSSQTGSNGSFGGGGSTVSVGTSGSNANSLPSFSASSASGASTQLVFKIADGPVISGVLIDTSAPTTTFARYLTAEDGHILDLALDTEGAAPRIVSNTTIPGIENAIWTNTGNGVVVQYLDSGSLKSAHISLPAATTTPQSGAAPQPTSISFLPDNIISLAVSPSGSMLAYLVANKSGGSDGYLSNTDGSNAKKTFSLPLTQVVISWPATTTVFAQSKSASGIAGIALAIQTKTGTVSPMLYGNGLTVAPSPALNYMLYRTDDGAAASLFSEKVSSNATASISPLPGLQAPFPETCVWGTMATTSIAYCAAPAQTLPESYLDLWYRGQASLPDALVTINPISGATALVATPGTRDGGETSDMINLSISKGGAYLSFVSKDGAALWGVHLH